MSYRSAGKGVGANIEIHAPVALFVYNRPWHTQKTVEALQRNDGAGDTDLVIYSDAPAKPEACESVQNVRSYVESIRGFRSVRIILREENWGLARSVVDGVTRLCNEYGKVIVLEDDLVTSPWFLKYMNDALIRYQNDERVISVHGFMFPVKEVLPETFFLVDPGCWGWATWARGWALYEPDGEKLLSQIKQQKRESEFNYSDSYDYLGMLENQVAGKNDSWAVRWYASAFLRSKLTLYPGISLVSNIGNDGSGRHGDDSARFQAVVSEKAIKVFSIPIIENVTVRRAMVNYLISLQQSWLCRKWRSVLQLVVQVWNFLAKR